MNKLSANVYKGIKFFTSLIEIKHTIIYSRSPASLQRASALVGRAVHEGCDWPTGFAPANQRDPPISGVAVTWRRRLASWLAGSAVSDGQTDGAWKLGFQGVGSAGAVRTRAGPETQRAPPWTPGAASFSMNSHRSPSVFVFTSFSGVGRGGETSFWIWTGLFSFPERRNAPPNSDRKPGVQRPHVCALSPGQRRGGGRDGRDQEEDNNPTVNLRPESALVFTALYFPPTTTTAFFCLYSWIWDFKMWSICIDGRLPNCVRANAADEMCSKQLDRKVTGDL